MTEQTLNQQYRSLTIAGYASALIFPILGLTIGIILLAHNVVRHGIAVIAVSLVWVLFWLALVGSLITAAGN